MTTDPIAAARALIEPLTGYTPGPWWAAVSGHPLNACAYVNAGYHGVATLYGCSDDVPQPAAGEPWGPHPIRDATARLIAAAPDLRGMVATLADALEAERSKVAAARLEGWRDGRDAAARSCVLSGQDLAEGDWGSEGRDMAVMLEARILALPEPKEASRADEYDPVGHDAWEAADALTALQAENQRLRATLSAITATDCYSRDECTAMARAALRSTREGRHGAD